MDGCRIGFPPTRGGMWGRKIVDSSSTSTDGHFGINVGKRLTLLTPVNSPQLRLSQERRLAMCGAHVHPSSRRDDDPGLC